LIDRFGLLPDAARNLLQSAKLRLDAMELGIRRIEGNDKGGFIEFGDKNHVDPMFLIGLLQKQPHIFRLDGPTKLKFIIDLSERKARLEFISDLLSQFAEHRV
ncbi:MAG: hypothetical protein L0K83_07445, partial [Lactobacillus sp.]|nr:hypothetical protein [Lactobacillus sp.]